jgi:uncharacterized protein
MVHPMTPLDAAPALPREHGDPAPDRAVTALAVWKLVAIGLVGGLFSGLLGVGGGIVMVPLLVMWASYTQQLAHAVSLAAIVPISIAGVTTYGVSGSIDVPVALALSAGAVLGAQVGARLLARSGERALKLAFGVLLLAVAISMMLHG